MRPRLDHLNYGVVTVGRRHRERGTLMFVVG